jgi:tripartite-type tricarboxylate transporter receptor subunit TctC
MLNRRGLLLSAPAAVAAVAPARAQAWPSRPIRLIVPFPPGGPNDIIARLYAPQLTDLLGQPVIVENRAGGGGVVGTDAAVRSPPDGYTLVITNGGSLVISPHVSANVPYKVPDDTALISIVTRVPEALVAHPGLGVRTLPELLDLARRRPGQLNIGTAGAAGLSHLTAELFKAQTGLDVVVVPYRGAAPSVTDLVGGQIQLLFADLPVLMPHIRGGTLTPLAMASARRSPALPDLPTTGELGLPELLADNWYCLVGPAGLPAPIAARLNEAARRASQTPAVRDGLAAQGAEATATTSAEFAAYVRSESEKWRRVAEAAGVRVD